MVARILFFLASAAVVGLGLPPGVPAQTLPGEVVSHAKISATAGGFAGPLDSVDAFGSATAALGDLDGDGIGDLAVGALGDDDGGPDRGAVWILFLNANASVKASTKISATSGGFAGPLHDGDRFGSAVGVVEDLDGDDIVELAVGAVRDDDGGLNRGAVWLLYLKADGTVKSSSKISAAAGGFTGVLDDLDDFGNSVASLGDLDGDGVRDLAVGAIRDDDGGPDLGAVWLLFLKADGTVKSHAKISATSGGFIGALDTGDEFGFALAQLDDLDGDGRIELAVGARQDDDGSPEAGSVYILFLQADGSVSSQQKISALEGGFGGAIDAEDRFGAALAPLGDLDGDGVLDLAVGANQDEDGGNLRGAVWILFLQPDGTVKSQQKISDLEGGFTGQLDDIDDFGRALACLGDHDGDGVADLAVGALWDDDGGNDKGAVWILYLNARRLVDLGNGLAGTHGVPALAAAGTLLAGDPFKLALTGTLEFSVAHLCIGVSVLNAPFKGGVLVPNVGALGIVLALPTGPAGTVTLNAAWPAGLPSDFSLYFQFWIQDAAGAFGFAASNALQAITP